MGGPGTSRYVAWSLTEHGEPARILATLLAGVVFLGLLPLGVVRIGRRLDRRLGLHPVRLRGVGSILGATVAVAGFSLGAWSVHAQLDRGRGTPLPMLPTHELLTDGPFRYCRNPMTLGAVLGYAGIAVTARTKAGLVLVLSLAAVLVAYLRRLEEPELAERFGAAYLEDRRVTPFMVPRLPRR